MAAATAAAVVQASAAAGEEDDEGAEKEADSGNEEGPSAAAVYGADVDVQRRVLELPRLARHDREPYEVAYQRRQRH